MAPSYAIILMVDLEEKILTDCDNFRISELLPPTIKLTINYSRVEINVLDVSVRKTNNELVTDLYIKPTDTHQYFHGSSCQVYHSKKPISYNQALRLNRICSKNLSYDKRCNELEVWLREQGHSDKLFGQQILKARKHKKKDLLNNMKDKRNDYQLVFNITYHPNLSNLKDTMSFLHLLLTPDQEHQKVFHKVPIIGFRRTKKFERYSCKSQSSPSSKK